MPPSTWNDENQHWIPQFLLKGFGIRKNASSVYQLDKQTKAITMRDVAQVASKQHQLTSRDDEQMKDIERRATTAIDAMRKGRLDRIGEYERRAVVRPPNGAFFIIGDSPVLTVRSTVNGIPSLLNPRSQVILPIHSRCVLAYAWSIETNVVDEGTLLTAEQVRSLNADYFHGTKCRYIYGRNEETLKQSSLMSLQWTPRERSQDLSRGWSMMLDQQFIRGERIAARDAAEPYILDHLARELVEAATTESEHSRR